MVKKLILMTACTVTIRELHALFSKSPWVLHDCGYIHAVVMVTAPDSLPDLPGSMAVCFL